MNKMFLLSLTVLAFELFFTNKLHAQEGLVFPARAENPGTNIVLGVGWNTETNTPTTDVCVTPNDQSTSTSASKSSLEIKRIESTYDFIKTTTVDSTATFKAALSKGSARVRFAADQELRGEYLNFAIQANVIKPSSTLAPGTRLKSEHAAFLQNNNKKDFAKACGDAYVYAILKGSSLTALWTFETTDTVTRENLSGSLNYSNPSLNISNDFSSSLRQASSKTKSKLTIKISGGDQEPIPAEPGKKLIEAVESLPSRTPEALEVVLYSYEDLPQVPEVIEEISDHDYQPYDVLAARYWGFNQLVKDYEFIDENRDMYIIGNCGAADSGNLPLMVPYHNPLQTLKEIALTMRKVARDHLSDCNELLHAKKPGENSNICEVPKFRADDLDNENLNEILQLDENGLGAYLFLLGQMPVAKNTIDENNRFRVRNNEAEKLCNLPTAESFYVREKLCADQERLEGRKCPENPARYTYGVPNGMYKSALARIVRRNDAHCSKTTENPLCKTFSKAPFLQSNLVDTAKHFIPNYIEQGKWGNCKPNVFCTNEYECMKSTCPNDVPK